MLMFQYLVGSQVQAAVPTNYNQSLDIVEQSIGNFLFGFDRVLTVNPLCLSQRGVCPKQSCPGLGPTTSSSTWVDQDERVFKLRARVVQANGSPRQDRSVPGKEAAAVFDCRVAD